MISHLFELMMNRQVVLDVIVLNRETASILATSTPSYFFTFYREITSIIGSAPIIIKEALSNLEINCVLLISMSFSLLVSEGERTSTIKSIFGIVVTVVFNEIISTPVYIFGCCIVIFAHETVSTDLFEFVTWQFIFPSENVSNLIWTLDDLWVILVGIFVFFRLEVSAFFLIELIGR